MISASVPALASVNELCDAKETTSSPKLLLVIVTITAAESKVGQKLAPGTWGAAGIDQTMLFGGGLQDFGYSELTDILWGAWKMLKTAQMQRLT